MKKTLLRSLLVSAAMAVGVSAQAQLPTDGGDYYLYNVGAKGYVIGANNWGTRASIVDYGGITFTTVEIGEGLYELLTSPTYIDRHLGFNGYVDNGDAYQYWSVIAQSDESVKLYTEDGNVLYWDGEGQTTTSVGTDPENDNSKWKFVTREQIIANLANASVSNPMDATMLIANSYFGRMTDPYLWTDSRGGGINGVNENMNMERYMEAFDIYQELTDIPNGLYRVSAQAAVTFHDNRALKDYDGNGYPLIYANDASADFIEMEQADKLTSQGKLSESFTEGKYFINSFDVVVVDGTMRIGAKSTRADIWAVWDNFKLEYLGEIKDLTPFVERYEQALAKANEIVSYPMEASLKSALNSAIETYASVDQTSQVALEEAIAVLTKAINDATSSIKAYEKLKAALDKGEAFIATCVEYGAPESCKSALNEIKAAYENGTVANADIDSTIAEIKSIMLVAAKQQTKAGADMTPLLNNPDFELSGLYEYNTIGWTTYSIDGGAVRTGGTGENKCYEAWNNGEFDIYQVVEDAPYGVYEIEVQGFYRYLRGENAWKAYLAQQVDYVKPAGVPVYVYMNDNATPFVNVFAEPVENGTLYRPTVSDGNNPFISTDGQYWFPNDMENAAIAFAANMYKQSAYGLVAFDGDVLRLGVKGKSNQGNDSWVIWDNFKLIYKGFDPEVIKPVLEEAVKDVEDTYIGLLMGKTEYAAFTNALAKAEEAIKNNDGEKMFEALRELYAAKDPALTSKDIFLAQEVATDTARLAEAIRDVAEAKMANKTRANANDLLYGLQNNLIYENDQIDQLKQDVTDMIDALNNSVALYADMNSQASTLRNDIATVKEQLPQLKVLTEAEALCDEADGYYANGTLDDENVPAFIESMKKMRQKLLEFLVNYTLMYSALQDLSNAINEGKAAGLNADLINEAQAIYDAGLAAYNAGEMGRGDMADEALKVTDETNKLRDAITALTTGINGVKTLTTDEPAYNMGGQKVKNQKGLIIRNQKKVIVK